jgi:hypothetical protein
MIIISFLCYKHYHKQVLHKKAHEYHQQLLLQKQLLQQQQQQQQQQHHHQQEELNKLDKKKNDQHLLIDSDVHPSHLLNNNQQQPPQNNHDHQQLHQTDQQHNNDPQNNQQIQDNHENNNNSNNYLNLDNEVNYENLQQMNIDRYNKIDSLKLEQSESNHQNNYTENFTSDNRFNQLRNSEGLMNPIKNDRLNDCKLQETQLPNINYTNNVDINKTDPIELMKLNNNSEHKEMSFDQMEKLRTQLDQEIKNGFDKEPIKDIRNSTEYNNKKDNKNININSIQKEIESEQKLHNSDLTSGNLSDDSLSFSFL